MPKKDEDKGAARPDSEELEPLQHRRGCGGLFLVIMTCAAAIWGGCLGAFVWKLDDAKTTIQALQEFRPKVGSKVYSADGELLGEFSTELRQLVNLSEIPLHVQKAFVATEDALFYEHKGVRPDAIVQAALYILRTGRTRGGSTITQQVVRIVDTLAVGQERTMTRKLREALIALQIERRFTKDEILELYLNQIFLGISARGVQAASQQYFSKDVWDLSLAEGAVLAGLTRGPNRQEPFHNRDNALYRRNVVLGQMLEHGFIAQEEYEAGLAEDMDASVITPEERKQLQAQGKGLWASRQNKAPYFVEEVRKYIFEQRADDEVLQEGLEIHTTIDMRLQAAAESALLDGLAAFDEKKLALLKKQNKENEFVPVTGALVCLDNRPGCKGYVRALVGGRDFKKEKFNTATQARRQPGSSVKPFVWAAAIAGGLTPSTVIVDEPYIKVDAWGNRWEPKNFGNDFHGPVTLRVALQKSINIVSIKLVDWLTVPVVRTYLQRAGIRTPIDNSPSIALGSPIVTVLDHCTAYSTLANLGVRHDPVMITEIKNRDGLTVEKAAPFEERAMEANVAYVVGYMMQGVARFGTGARGTAEFQRAKAGKTGTTNDSRDVWFCGFTPYFTCIVWVGYKDNRSLGRGNNYTGGRLAAPIWAEFMVQAEDGFPDKDFEVPEGVEFHDVDRNTGLAGGSFPEAFVEGTGPPVDLPDLEPQPESEPVREHLLETF